MKIVQDSSSKKSTNQTRLWREQNFKALAFCPWFYLFPHRSDILPLHQVDSFVSDVRRSLVVGQPRSHQQVLGSRRQWILASRTGPGGGKSRNSAKKETFITRSHGLILIRPGIHWICSSLDNWSGNLYSLVLVVLSNSHVQKYNYRIHWWFLEKTSLQASKLFWNYDQPAFTLHWCRS